MICAFDECKKEFEPHRHNQKYCSSECCKYATNKRIRDKYYETKKRLSGQMRVCVRAGCNTILSRYTEGDTCGKCLSQDVTAEKDELKRLFGVV